MCPADTAGAPSKRDPETLLGPVLLLFTNVASSGTHALPERLRLQLLRLAADPVVPPFVRMSAGALLLERRGTA